MSHEPLQSVFIRHRRHARLLHCVISTLHMILISGPVTGCSSDSVSICIIEDSHDLSQIYVVLVLILA